MDVLIGCFALLSSVLSVWLLVEPRRVPAGRTLAADEIVIVVADEGNWGSVRREGVIMLDEGAMAKVSRRETGGAGIPETLCFLADMGARRCDR